MGQLGFWNLEERYAKLVAKKDLLIHPDQVVPWQEFRPTLQRVHEKPRKSEVGRKPHDVIVMFKLLIPQKLCNLSDEELEYQVNDRLSFIRFLALGIDDRVPDATTVWLFREQLQNYQLIDALFEQFEEYLKGHGYASQGGQIVDATLIPVPKQRNSKPEHDQIQQSTTPEKWKEKPHKQAQKDTDARWTKKNGRSHFDYKDHISRDVTFGFIRNYAVSDASVHDSKLLGQILDGDNADDGVCGDRAYRSEGIETALDLLGFDSHIHERAYRNRPLSDTQKQTNRERSCTRALVEHVFGDWAMTMDGKLVLFNWYRTSQNPIRVEKFDLQSQAVCLFAEAI